MAYSFHGVHGGTAPVLDLPVFIPHQKIQHLFNALPRTSTQQTKYRSTINWSALTGDKRLKQIKQH